MNTGNESFQSTSGNPEVLPISRDRFFVKEAEKFQKENDISSTDFLPIPEARLRGGCGNCGKSMQFTSGISVERPSSGCQHHQQPAKQKDQNRTDCEFLSKRTSKASTKGENGCPCGGCGGAACSDNPGGGGIEGGCCGGPRLQGLPCKCKCQSCDAFRPLGGCGGQSCGRIYSCAGSGGGRCCFPRNTKRRFGPECCGGANSNCGGCC